jgi:hypothetical protein
VLEEIQDSTEALLMEGMRQLDEYRRIEPDLPAREDAVGVAAPLQAALRDLQPNELDTLQLVINYGQFQAVLDRSPRTDLETAQTLLTLIQRDYVTVRR